MKKFLLLALFIMGSVFISTPSFAEKIRIVAFSWTCPSCEASNPDSATHCRICGRCK